MFNYSFKAGSTSKSLTVRIIDSTTGVPVTSYVFNSAGMDLQYQREGAASTAITEATLAALTTAWSSGGFLHRGNGYYRVDIPDAALAAGADGVLLHGTVTGGVVIGAYVQLVAYDPFDTVRLGLTALPNAAAEAAGGLYTRGSGAGQINQTANGRVDANSISQGGTTLTARDIGASVLLSTGTGTGQLDFTSGVVKASLVQILGTALTETVGQIAAAFKKWFDVAAPVGTVNSIPNATAGAAGGLFIAGTNAATTITTALTTTFTGNLTGSVGSVTGAVGSVTGAVGSVTGAVGSVTAGVTLATVESAVAHSGTATAGAGSTITLAAGASATDNFYNGMLIKLYGGTGIAQARQILSYVGSTKVATVDRAWVANPDSSSTYAVLWANGAKLDATLQVTAASVQGNVTGSVASVTGAVGSVTGNVGGNVVGTVATVTGNVNGTVASVTGAVGSVTGAVGSVTGNVGGNVVGTVASVAGNVSGNVTGSVGSLAAQAKTDVNAEVVDAIFTDVYTEPGQEAPPVSLSLVGKVGYLYKFMRNKVTQSSTTLSIFGDDASTVHHKSPVSDDGTTYTRNEFGTGP